MSTLFTNVLLLNFVFGLLWSFGIGNLMHQSNAIAIKIVQEPASINYPDVLQPNTQSELVPRVAPSNFSGPKFLEKLTRNCYSFSNHQYRFELYPFHNVTQHETSQLWNAYKGIVGTWQDWKIENNSYVAMVFGNGDPCGSISREAYVCVYLHCGQTNAILNVTEPQKCKYRVDFSTPLLCFEDSLLVYPTLPIEFQEKWNILETEYRENIITEKGYQKYLENVFVEAGILLSKDKISKDKDENPRGPKTTSAISAKREIDNSTDFADLEQCLVNFKDLKKEIEELRKELSSLRAL